MEASGIYFWVNFVCYFWIIIYEEALGPTLSFHFVIVFEIF